MSGTRPTVCEYGTFQQPAEPAVPRLPDGARRRAPVLRTAPAGTWRRSSRPPTAAAARLARRGAARGGAGRASRRRAERRGGRRERATPGAGRRRRDRDRPAGRCSSGARSSCCTRPWPRSRSRSGCRSALGAPVVPVFWVASDDHDFAEVRSVSVLDDAGPDPHAALRARAASPSASPRPASSSTRPSRRCSTSCGAALPAGLHRDAVLERWRGVLSPGRVRSPPPSRGSCPRCFPDLVVLDPSDPALKRADGAGAVARAAGGLAHLAARPRGRPASCWPPATTSRSRCATGFLNLFLLMDGERRALAVRERRRSRCAASGARSRSREALRMLEADARATGAPASLLRPLAQDLHAADRAPTWAARPRSPTTRRSAPRTRTSASRARSSCRGRA